MRQYVNRIWLIALLFVLVFAIYPHILLAINMIKVENISELYNLIDNNSYFMNLVKCFLAIYPASYFKILGIIFLGINLEHYLLLVSYFLSFIVNNKKIKILLGSYFILLVLIFLVLVTQGIVLMNTIAADSVISTVHIIGYVVLIGHVIFLIFTSYLLIRNKN